MAKKKTRTVKQILMDTGKTDNLQQAFIEVGYRMKVTPFTMKHWIIRGIPQERWGFFIEGGYATAEELVAANKLAKRK